MEARITNADDVLSAWRQTVNTEERAHSLQLQQALVTKGARIETVSRPSGKRSDSPIESYLSVTYNGKTAQIRFADEAQETVQPPQGMIIYNMLASMIGPR